ncbi:NAD(P)H-dependent oxidoreductase [Bacteriovoracaceae bacterium]|nr:NAD(P)H-dependent oxidoreductase [Bacteriovoracaceae bacterium]
MSIIDDLSWRYATKEFDSEKKLSNEQLNSLLESLRLSASSFGLQPWKFVVVDKQEQKEKLLAHSWNQRQVVDASHVIVLCRPTKFGEEDVIKFVKCTAEMRNQEIESLEGFKKVMVGFLSRMDEASINAWMKNQIYIALGSLLTVAAHLKIDACPMEGFIAPKYDEVLGLADHGLSSVVVCPVGFRNDKDKYASLAKIRYTQDETVLKL